MLLIFDCQVGDGLGCDRADLAQSGQRAGETKSDIVKTWLSMEL
jgi:hypothetical protein